MATVPVGNGFYNRKANDVKRTTSEWAAASDNGGHPKNVKRIGITNGYSITRGLRRKRNIALSASGNSRSKWAKGKVKSFSIKYFKY